MFRPVIALVLSAGALLLCAPGIHGQSVGATTGAIEGTVTDGTGARLPGVAITVSSEALMALRTTVTAADGSYAFPALPPGRFSVSFALAGFATAKRADVRVGLGATVTLDLLLETSPVEEVVTVEGGAAIVDRRATMNATLFDREELTLLPGSRTIGSILAATPAVQLTRHDVGGSTAFGVGPFSVYGTSGFNRPTIEGISVSGMNPFGFALDYGTFANVWVGTGAYGPEWPTPGLHMQVVTKSGGNRYAGAVYAGYEHGGWQAYNIDERQIELGAPAAAGVPAVSANRLQRYRDLNGDVGGFLIRNRLWFYASARDHAAATRQPIFPVQPLETHVTTMTGKGTWRLNDAHQVVVFAQGSRNRQPIRLDGFLRTATARNTTVESTTAQLATGLVWKTEWSAVIGTRMLAGARAGQFAPSRAERPNGSSPRTEDLLRPDVSGGNRDWREELQSDQLNASISYFHDGPVGRHQLKAGVEVQRTLAAEEWTAAYPGDVLHVTQNGIPRQVYLFQTPSRSENGQWWYAAYAGDTWRIEQRLTINLGLRFDRFRVFLPEQHHRAGRFNPVPRTFSAVASVAAWNVIAPRLAASYDVRGDGRTIAKTSYGLHWLPPTNELAFNVNPNGRVWWERFKWADANGDGLWHPGEEFDRQETRGGEAIDALDPGLKLPYIHEIAARLDRATKAGLVVGMGVTWRGERQHGARQRAFWPFDAFSVPLTLRDSGADARPGSSDDGPDIQVFELTPELLAQSQIVVRNPPHAENEHLTWEALARRRFHRKWSMFASFAVTWNRDHAREYLGQPVRANEFPLTPNDLIHTDRKGRHVFRDWSARIHGTWAVPAGLRVTPLVRHQSGQAFGRTIVAALNHGPIRVLAEPVGTRRQNHVTLLDLRLDKDIRIAAAGRLTPFLEVFNALNTNPAQTVSWETGDSFLRPLVIVPPRILRVGLQLNW